MRGKGISLPHPGQGVEGSTVHAKHPFRSPCRPRRIEQVSDIIGHDATDRISVTVPGNGWPLRLQTDHLCSMSWQPWHKVLLGQHHGGLRIIEHEGQALLWIGRVKGHVGCPSFEDAE